MTKKLICLRGICASGKSSWALKQEGAVVFNKDTIRGALHDSVYSRANEKEVVEYERQQVEKYIDIVHPYIIVDNTHLGRNNKHLEFYKELAKKNNYEFIIKDFYCSREEAIKRDKARANSVGVEVIDKMIKQSSNGGMPSHPTFREINPELPACYVFDIDGTLAFMKGKRSPYDYSKVGGDECNEHLKSLLGDLAFTSTIIILSGRDGVCKEETKKWLKDNDIIYNHLYMRAEGDTRKDSIIKRELYEKHLKGKYNVMGVFDDRNQVVDEWRLELNLPCYQAWYGNF